MNKTKEIIKRNPILKDDYEIFGDLNPKFIEHYLKVDLMINNLHHIEIEEIDPDEE